MAEQRHYCTGCKQTRHDTRQYFVLTTGQRFHYCKACAAGMNNIEPAIKQKVPARWAK